MTDLSGTTLEDFIYDDLHEATTRGGAEYAKGKVARMFNFAESCDPTSLEDVDREDDVVGVAWVDNAGKAAYGFLEYKDNTVELDIKSFGDEAGVANYIDDLPSKGYTKDVETVVNQAMRNATVRADEHAMEVETETQLSPPGEVPSDESFTSSHAERIRREVAEETI